MSPSRRTKTLAFESLEDRKVLATSTLALQASAAIQTLTQQATVARQQVSPVSSSQQIAALSTAVAKDLQANSLELANAYKVHNAADIQQQTSDQTTITNDLKRISLDQAGVGRTVGDANVNISKELSARIQEVTARLNAAIKSGATTLVTSDIIANEQANLNAIVAGATSQLNSIVADAQAAKRKQNSLVGNSITTPPTPPSPPAPVVVQGNFTGSFNVLFLNSSGLTLSSPGTLNASLSIANNVLSGNVTSGKLLQYLPNNVPDGFANITGGTISGTVSGTSITGTLTVDIAATANIAAHTEVLAFTATLFSGRVISGTFSANGNVKGGNITLAKV